MVGLDVPNAVRQVSGIFLSTPKLVTHEKQIRLVGGVTSTDPHAAVGVHVDVRVHVHVHLPTLHAAGRVAVPAMIAMIA